MKKDAPDKKGGGLPVRGRVSHRQSHYRGTLCVGVR